ncbi:hypothetical protein RRG08_016374 [Elysia crispata]|uniref:Uncharacterized protein n=1 Tax=Elysia crispata TaxID=231223 RepID=A0AAE1DYP9_9GAST|nr:hypothetical protein RRG08_016374 [Elysia crispata]
MSSYALSATSPHDRHHYHSYLHHNHLDTTSSPGTTDANGDNNTGSISNNNNSNNNNNNINNNNNGGANENSSSPGPNFNSCGSVDSAGYYSSSFSNGQHLYHPLSSRFEHLSYRHPQAHPTFLGYPGPADFSMNHWLDLKRHAYTYSNFSNGTFLNSIDNHSHHQNITTNSTINASNNNNNKREDAEEDAEEDEEDESDGGVDKKPSLLHIDTFSTTPSGEKSHDNNNNNNSNNNKPVHTTVSGQSMYSCSGAEIATSLQGRAGMKAQQHQQNQYQQHRQHPHPQQQQQQQQGSLHPSISCSSNSLSTITSTTNSSSNNNNNNSSHTGHSPSALTNRSTPPSPGDRPSDDRLTSGYQHISTDTSPTPATTTSLGNVYGPDDDNNGE